MDRTDFVTYTAIHQHSRLHLHPLCHLCLSQCSDFPQAALQQTHIQSGVAFRLFTLITRSWCWKATHHCQECVTGYQLCIAILYCHHIGIGLCHCCGLNRCQRRWRRHIGGTNKVQCWFRLCHHCPMHYRALPIIRMMDGSIGDLFFATGLLGRSSKFFLRGHMVALGTTRCMGIQQDL